LRPSGRPAARYTVLWARIDLQRIRDFVFGQPFRKIGMITIVDLRHSLDFEAEPETIPGAFRMDAKELEEKTDRFPHDREVILYCT
jgi:hypothetical protein